jgi:hypothetical protein
MKTPRINSTARTAKRTAAAVVVALAAAAGCAHKEPAPVAKGPPPQPMQVQDMGIVDAIGDAGIRSAIVTQHTLFPYHFAADSDTLNELGQDELAVLISHLRTVGGGQLNVRAGDAPEPLYSARVRYVRDMLRKGGVDPATVKIADAPAGGEGTPSTTVLRALTAEANKQTFGSSAGQGGNSNSSSNQGGATGGGGGGTPAGNGGGMP